MNTTKSGAFAAIIGMGAMGLMSGGLLAGCDGGDLAAGDDTVDVEVGALANGNGSQQGTARNIGRTGPAAPPCDRPAPAGRVALTPDATGWIAPGSNSVGIQGAWYPVADGYGLTGLRDGNCQAAGYSDSECSVVTTPIPGQPFTNVGGVMCTSGVAAQVIAGSDGQPDYGNIWGAGIAFDLAGSTSSAPNGVFNARAHAVIGISFDIDVVPPGFRVGFPTPASMAGTLGSSYWGATASYPNSPVVAGTNTVLFSAVQSPEAIPVPLDVTQLLAMQFHVAPDIASAHTFAYCVRNVKAILAPRTGKTR